MSTNRRDEQESLSLKSHQRDHATGGNLATVLMRPVVEEEEIITGRANDHEDHERDDEKPDALLFRKRRFFQVAIVDGRFSLHIDAVILDCALFGGPARHRGELQRLVGERSACLLYTSRCV